MSGRLIFFFCIAVFAPTIVFGLQCYQCTLCSETFSASSATIVESNSTGESCYKTKAAAAITRGVTPSCAQVNALGIGTWCCNTDLCNGAQSITPTNLKIIITSLLLTIIMVKIIHRSGL